MKPKNCIFTFLLFMSIINFSCSADEQNNKKVNIDSKNKREISRFDTINNSDKISDSVNKEELISYKFICPQGDKKGNSNTEGICSVCGMELIENVDFQ